MSICDKCPDGGLCDKCFSVHTFSRLSGQNALEQFYKWAFDHPVNEEEVIIAHTSSNDAHYKLSYLITNREYPDILDNGGKLLEMKI